MWFILTFQILGLLSLIQLAFFGSLTQWLICLMMYFLMSCVGGSVTFHRLVAHKSWQAPQWFWVVGSILGSLSWSGSPLTWAAVHREHHSHMDTEKDPHSPHHKGGLWIQFLLMFHKPKLSYVRDLQKMKHQIWIHRNYLYLNLAFDLILLSLDPWAVLYAHWAPAAMTWHAGNLVNVFNHFKPKSESEYSVRNLPVLGILAFGEGWHKNHHLDPASPFFGMKGQLDIGAWVIRLLQRFRHE